LAVALGTDLASVSRRLTELRGIDVVEYAELGEKGDARSRPHRLTLQGESLAERLGGAAVVDKPTLEPVIRTAVSICTQLAIEDRVSIPKTESTMRRILGPSGVVVSNVLDKVLAEFDLGQRSWAREVFSRILERAAEGVPAPKAQGAPAPADLHAALDRVAKTGASVVYIRCARNQQALWDQVISASKLPRGSRTIGPADIDVGDVPQPADPKGSIVYDCAPILQSDLQTEPSMKYLVDGSGWKFCMGRINTKLPNGFELLPMEAP
jgi:hypothetical protein